MVPPSIRKNLAGLRRRERLLTFVWGLACFVAIALGLLLLCAFADWLIDRERDTPMLVREFFVALQLGVWAIAGFWFILWPQIRRLPDEMLALWVEDKVRRFDHRLISAVQLNKKGAKLEGMSQELVKVVTREAEIEAQAVRFAQIADHRRLGWAIGVAAPAVLLFLVPLALAPHVSFVLLARQTLADIEIPRSVYLKNESVAVWPIGDEIPIRYRVTGQYTEDMIGSVNVSPGGRFELTFVAADDKGAIFGANIEPSKLPVTDELTFSARLADGRTRRASQMQLVPRPVITENRAWVILPAYCDTRPIKDKRRYERQQASGNVVAIPGSAVRVQFETQRLIKEAWLELRGPEVINAKRSAEDALHLVDKGKLAMTIQEGTKFNAKTKETVHVWVAETTFDLTDGLSRYVMKAKDEHGFLNVPKPPQTLDIVPEGPPQVMLLKDTFDLQDGSTFDLEGLPVVLGRAIRVPYSCDGAYGLSRARLLYRVLKKHESGKEPQEEEEFTKLELPEFHPTPAMGSFDRRTGVFEKMSFQNQVAFYLIPSRDPEKELGRTMGGGRYFLQTKDNALINSKGTPIKLKPGDLIEYCVEVFAAEREPKSSIPSARSETRVTSVMEEKEFSAWMRLVGQEDERVRQLEKLQRAIFERK